MPKESNWIFQLEDEEIRFIKNFILSSGSLKELSKIYTVSYPTVRNRLDHLMERIKLVDEKQEDPYVHYIKKLALDDQFTYETAKHLIEKYKERVKENG
ncbi:MULTISPECIES: DUF2089 family protein [Gracilibacillus]|uniref:DUF2089 family protein n=1 Tax=Gracilibacillus TaxID=74385 RepID=UPI000824409E|nr:MULTISPECIES: DUF2089 family protein [Gracilibacillus]